MSEESLKQGEGMSGHSYRLILEGTTKEGLVRSEVVSRLAVLFKMDESAVERLLSGAPRVIRKDLDLRTAEKYQRAIDRAGAVVSIDSSPEPVPAPVPELDSPPEEGSPPKETAPPEEDRPVCPRCGYVPRNDNDVMLVRGDCPRCGLMVRRMDDVATGPAAESSEDEEARAESSIMEVLEQHTAASLYRRALASIHSFGMGLSVYCFLVMLFVFCFLPVNSFFGEIFARFPQTAYNGFPKVLVAASIALVTFVAPLFYQGRSFGQKALEIGILYGEEVQSGGLLLALAFRSVVILFLSYAPGLALLRMAELFAWMGFVAHPYLTMAMTAGITWLIAWTIGLRSPGKRGLLDQAAGTLQIEELPLPQDALKRALQPLAAALGFLLVFWVLLPGLFAAFGQ